MTTPVFPRTAFAFAGLAASIFFHSALASGQSVAPTPSRPDEVKAAPEKTEKRDEVVELNPFTAEATKDDSYGALNSNSITSFNAQLEKLPMSADIFTSAFMEDTNSTTLESMLRNYSAGAGTGSAAGDPGGIPVNQPLDRGGGDSVSAGVQLRGLGASVVKQDGFMLPSPAGTGMNSNFGVERNEIIFGPQSLLYGNGGGGGVLNIISKQARLGKAPAGAVKFQVDQYGHKLGQVDYGMGTRKFAFTFSVLHQDLGDNRTYLGGPLDGIYLQFAAKVFGNTIIRLTGKETKFDRYTQQTVTLNAGSAAADSRNGQSIRYLLASNQINRSAVGASGAGVIGNGALNWDNVDSYGGNLREEIATAKLSSLTAETVWNSWLSTQISAGYQGKQSKLGFGSGVVFYSPNAAANPLPGNWTVASGGSSGSSYSNQPSRSKSFRFSALLTNRLFDNKVSSQTILGADFTQGNYANENYSYYEADSNYNVVLTNGARTKLTIPGEPNFAANDGPVKYPFFKVGTQRITYKGKNYVAQVMNQTDPTLISPQNPQGVTAGDIFIHSRGINRGLYAVNFTQWGENGKLATLVGARYVSADNRQLASTAIPAIRAQGNNLSFSAGVNYGLTSWLRPYVTISDTYNLPGILLTVVADPVGNPAPVSHAIGEEAGFKIGDERARVSGSVAVFAVQANDDPYSIPSQLRDSINPAGLNGRYLGATGIVIPIERKSIGAQAILTANLIKGLRTRFSAAFIQGTIGNDTSYSALYNDQFYQNSANQVTYANGTVVYVRPTFLATPGTSANAGYIPLTVGDLSSPGSAYYANPDPTTGLIQTSNGRTILNYTASPNGPIKTGVNGLPISQIQLSGVNPAPTIITSRNGDKTTGYPESSFSFTNFYTVQTGWFRGVKLGGTVNASWKLTDYYYYPNGYGVRNPRKLLYRPTQALFNGIVGYERRYRGLVFSTQLNIDNMFNHYDVFIRPNNITGYSGINSALFTTQQRTYTWTNTIKF